MTEADSRRLRFYRHWSSQAAELALATSERHSRSRYAHCAGVWALIAETLEAGDEVRFSHLTRNIVCLAGAPSRS